MRFPRDLFLPDNGRFFVVRDCRVIDRRSCRAVEIQVSLVSRFVLARQPHKADEIVISVLLIVGSEEEDGGENGSDLDEVGVGWLAVFDLELFLSYFRRAWRVLQETWSWILPVRVVLDSNMACRRGQ